MSIYELSILSNRIDSKCYMVFFMQLIDIRKLMVKINK